MPPNDNERNGGSFRVGLTQLLLTIIAALVALYGGFGLASRTQGQEELRTIRDSVVLHHQNDDTRDAVAQSELATLKDRQERMERMLERLSYRLGVEVPPRRQDR